MCCFPTASEPSSTVVAGGVKTHRCSTQVGRDSLKLMGFSVGRGGGVWSTVGRSKGPCFDDCPLFAPGKDIGLEVLGKHGARNFRPGTPSDASLLSAPLGPTSSSKEGSQLLLEKPMASPRITQQGFDRDRCFHSNAHQPNFVLSCKCPAPTNTLKF